jgi:aryl-alcohol dehydrogenase-like predicted oxidoreductase
VRGVRVTLNRWEPWNVVDTHRTGHIDAVQVIYNIFDQAPEDELFPLCRELDVAVIARVPFDEGSLAGALSAASSFPEGDFRRIYFGPENLEPTLQRVAALRPLVPDGSSLPELALRFILSEPLVSTVIPGMRRVPHVRANVAAAERGAMDSTLVSALREHRWDREPAAWSL